MKLASLTSVTRALCGGQQALERAGGVEAAEAAASDHDLPGHADRIGFSAMNDSLYADALAPFLAEVERAAPGEARSDRRPHPPRPRRGRPLADARAAARPARRGAGARRACVFPLHDPERKPAYSLPNDRVLAWAGESEGRLVPFCRLDPAEGPLAEGERCLAAGARGIKLHPRAQDFDFDGEEMDDVFELAEEARVPILIHAGRGPAAAGGRPGRPRAAPSRGAVLILAHGAICDQGILTTRLADHPGVLYDISCFFPLDVIELFARVPAERIVFASDPPYGLPATTLYMALRVARQAGLDEAATRPMLGGTMAALMDGRELPADDGRRGAGPRSRSRGGSRASTATRAWSDRRCSPARRSRRGRCSTWRSPPAATPSPGTSARRWRRSGAALRAADVLLDDEDGVRPAIDLALPGERLRRAPSVAGRGPDAQPAASSQRAAHSPLLAGARARACRSAPRGEGRATSSASSRSSPPAIRCARRTGERAGELEQQRTQQVGEDHRRARPSPAGRQSRAAARCAGRSGGPRSRRR